MNWKNSRAEAAMRKGTEKIRLAAQKKAEEESNLAEIKGKYIITFKATDNVEEGEIENILSKIEEFSKECDKNAPNVSITIKPAELSTTKKSD